MGRLNTRDLIREELSLPPHETVRIVIAATGRRHSQVVAGCELSADEFVRIEEMIEQRRSGHPLQYLEGTVPFGPVFLAVDRRALIPRPETEYLHELASKSVGDPRVIVDIGTGSGCLAIALKTTFPAARVIGTDISPLALSLAHENAARNAVDVEFHVGDLYEAVPGEVAGYVDLLVSNPPYVSTAEMHDLPNEISDWEPRLALDGGDDGLRLIRPLVEGLFMWLATDGVALIELGSAHARLAARLAESPFSRAEVVQDLAGRDRYLKIEAGLRQDGEAD